MSAIGHGPTTELTTIMSTEARLGGQRILGLCSKRHGDQVAEELNLLIWLDSNYLIVLMHLPLKSLKPRSKKLKHDLYIMVPVHTMEMDVKNRKDEGNYACLSLKLQTSPVLFTWGRQKGIHPTSGMPGDLLSGLDSISTARNFDLHLYNNILIYKRLRELCKNHQQGRYKDIVPRNLSSLKIDGNVPVVFNVRPHASRKMGKKRTTAQAS